MSSETLESTRSIEFLAWLEVHAKKLIAGGLIVALLIGGYALYRWRTDQLEKEANSALVQIQMRRSPAGSTVQETKGEELLQFADRYRNTHAGRRALLLGATALFREGKYEESLARFQDFRSRNAGSPLVDTAVVGAAACLEAMGKTEEAITAYREVIASFPQSAAASQSRLALAALLESKNEYAQALNLYDQLNTSAWASEAGRRREAILAAHPELAPAAEPAVKEEELPVAPMPESGAE